MRRTYYVYVYLDPDRPGKYVYGEYSFDFEPFYIGKGTGPRMEVHLVKRLQIKPGTNPFYDKLNNMKQWPIIEKVVSKLTSEEAELNEIKLIYKIGRKCTNEGPLLNLTAGGTGGDTFSKLSPERKAEVLKKRSESMKGKNRRPCSEEQKKKISQTLTGRKNPEHSLKMKGRKQTPEAIIKRIDKIKKKIKQINLEGNEIRIWDSAKDAANSFGKDASGLIQVCRGRKKTFNGYKWEYA